jgi:hypothetical protein
VAVFLITQLSRVSRADRCREALGGRIAGDKSRPSAAGAAAGKPTIAHALSPTRRLSTNSGPICCAAQNAGGDSSPPKRVDGRRRDGSRLPVSGSAACSAWRTRRPVGTCHSRSGTPGRGMSVESDARDILRLFGYRAQLPGGVCVRQAEHALQQKTICRASAKAERDRSDSSARLPSPRFGCLESPPAFCAV